MKFSVCSAPPSKVDFVNAMGFIQPLKEIDPDDAFGPTREWFQLVAENIAKKCRHIRCGHDSQQPLRLVKACYKPHPKPLLNPSRPNGPYFQTDTYENDKCCKIDSQLILNGDFPERYGYAVAKDILLTEMKDVESCKLRDKINSTDQAWYDAFVEEMRILLSIED